MMKMWDRYQEDPVFHAMVQSLLAAIEAGQITPTEAREAAMLAQILYEERHQRPMIFTRKDVIKGLV